ncbi:MAG: hypothetical protein FJ291_14150 [Planctomycetes bacterium]|nr:hypothetical protein [Planctomycetota bacterium]
MRQPSAAALCALAAIALGLQSAHAVGLRVSPGGALIQGIEPGQKAELAVPVTVMNDDPEPKTVSFATLAPRKGNMKVPPGYSDIPDPAWLTFSKSEVEVPAKGSAAVKMTLSIPEGKQYHNQHWSVALAVRMKAAPGHMLAIGLYPRIEIETSPARPRGGLLSRPKPPLGDLVVTPSLETLAGVAPAGPPKRVALDLWNNSPKPWRGEVSIVTGAEEAKKARLDLSGGWTWLPDASWVKPKAAGIEVGANGAAEIALDVAVPAGKEHHDRAWEAIVLVKGADKSVAFARLRVKTGL